MDLWVSEVKVKMPCEAEKSFVSTMRVQIGLDPIPKGRFQAMVQLGASFYCQCCKETGRLVLVVTHHHQVGVKKVQRWAPFSLHFFSSECHQSYKRVALTLKTLKIELSRQFLLCDIPFDTWHKFWLILQTL